MVATYNRAGLLKRMLDALDSQDLDPAEFEVIVVDDGSSDETPSVLESAQPRFSLRTFRQSNQGPAAARNLAIANAAADVIITIDDDVVPATDLLRRHLALQETEKSSAAMGMMVLPPNKHLSPWLEWEAVSLDKQYRAMMRGDWVPTPRQFYTANASFRKEDAIKAGLFDTTFRRAEDVELAYRLRDIGVSFHFLPDAIVYHEPNRSYADWLRIPWLYGYYDLVMARDKGREYILGLVQREFAQRNGTLRAAGRILVGRQRLLSGVVSGASGLATASARAGLRRPSLALYSAVFNLQYWQGICEAAGEGTAFWEVIGGQKTRMRQPEARQETALLPGLASSTNNKDGVE